MTVASLNPVLVVDDEADIRDLMEMTLMRMGLRTETATCVTEAKSRLESRRYALVLTDMRMPDGLGVEVVQHINTLKLDTPIAVITAYGNADEAQAALKAGAFDYLQKPITLAQLRSLVKSAIKVNEPEATPPRLRPDPVMPSEHPKPKPIQTASTTSEAFNFETPEPAKFDIPPTKPAHNNTSAPTPESKSTVAPTQPIQTASPSNDLPRLLGQSPQMDEVRHLVRKLAASNVPVYISGESGSGKEQAARSIHELSERRDKPFIAVNCGAIPENLMESEFFGYKKGSFTGADQDRLGFFQHANGGTLFLDEVADLPLAMQVKLLRAIQEKAVRRIGDAQETHVDVRILSATHKNLNALVDKGAFRQDLYYRLNVVTLSMPPLREMREDLPALITRLLHKYRIGDNRYQLEPEAQKALFSYSYPGNFRELENILERAVALCSGQIIRIEDLQLTAESFIPSSYSTLSNEEAEFQANEANEEPDRSLLNPPVLPPFLLGQTDIQAYLDIAERNIIEQVLELTGHNRTQAAKLMGISFRSMRYRLERLGIE